MKRIIAAFIWQIICLFTFSFVAIPAGLTVPAALWFCSTVISAEWLFMEVIHYEIEQIN